MDKSYYIYCKLSSAYLSIKRDISYLKDMV